MRPLLKIADTNFAHGTSLGSGDLKLYPQFFDWYRGDENINDVVVITDTQLTKVDRFKESKKIAWLLEPACVYDYHYKWIKENYQKFDHVLTHNDELLQALPNAQVYFYGGCWIKPEERKIYKKKKKISIIVSDKQYSDAQKMRHQIVKEFDPYLDVYGKGYNPVENKLQALKDYEFSIVIENEKSKWWVTEKFFDAVAVGTIPIYRGCPNITDYLSGTAIVEFNTINQLAAIIEDILVGYRHKHSKFGIEHNFDVAKQFYCPEDWLYKNFLKPKGLLP